MRFDILTLFPDMFTGPLTESILKRAQQAGLIEVHLHQIRDYATDRHRTTDDTPYGGGAGMVMKPEPLAAAIRAVCPPPTPPDTEDTDTPIPTLPAVPAVPVVLLTPDGEPFTQLVAEQLSREEQLVLVCGRYEGVDERFRAMLVTREVSIGDYVLTGGELAAMVVVDAVSRLVPGVLDAESTLEESHGDGLLEYPHYTRPGQWEGQDVPTVLRSGHHAQVAAWRHRQRLSRTLKRRPDMFVRAAARGDLTLDDLDLLLLP